MEFFFNYMVRFMKPNFLQMFVPDLKSTDTVAALLIVKIHVYGVYF